MRTRVCFWVHCIYYKRVRALSSPLIHRASDKCKAEKRKTINGEDLLYAMNSLGFDKYVEPLRMYLSRYREVHSSFEYDIVGYSGYTNRTTTTRLWFCLLHARRNIGSWYSITSTQLFHLLNSLELCIRRHSTPVYIMYDNVIKFPPLFSFTKYIEQWWISHSSFSWLINIH